MTVPADITSIVTTDIGKYLFIVRETNDLVVSCGNGNCTFYNLITITSDAVGGVYPDDPSVGWRLALSDLGAVYVYTGNISYIHFGMSDFAYTISRVSGAWTTVGSPYGSLSGTEYKHGFHLYAYKCSVGTAAGHYNVGMNDSVYLREVTFKKGDYTWFMQYGGSAGSCKNIYWHDCTMWLAGGLFVAYAPMIQSIFIIGSVTFTTVNGYWNSIDVTKLRAINVRIVDSGGNPISEAFISVQFTGNQTNYNRVSDDIYRLRETDSTGRPNLDTTLIRNLNVLFNISQLRNEMKAFFVPYSVGYLNSANPMAYAQLSATDPAVTIWVMKGTMIASLSNAMAADLGTPDVPVDITLAQQYSVTATFLA